MPQQPFIGQDIAGQVKVQVPTPNPQTQELIAALESNIDNYVAVLCGTPPPENTHPGYMLSSQMPIDWAHVQRFYAKDRNLQGTYNASISYDGEAAAFPIFSRDYIVRRYNYTPTTRGSVLAGLVSATVTAAGTGYTQATVSVSLAGGTGSGGAITALVSDGVIVALAITAEGTYTVAPTITITDTGSGTGATGTCAVQLQAAVLIKEDFLRTPDSPLDGLWVLVRRIYMTLPGVILTSKQMDDSAQGAVTVTTKQKLATGAADYTPDWKTLSYSDQALSANIKERTVTTMPDSVFPTLTDYDQDPEMLSLITTTFQVVDASAVTPPSIVTGVITRFKHIDKWRSIKIVETYATPASYSEQKFSGQNFPNLFSAFYNDTPCGTIMIERGAFSAMVKIRLDISFGAFTSVDGLTLIPNTFAYGSFRVSDILNDAATLVSSGDCSYVVDLPASSPSKSTYQAYGATPQLVSGESVLWKAGLFRTTKLYVVMI